MRSRPTMSCAWWRPPAAVPAWASRAALGALVVALAGAWADVSGAEQKLGRLFFTEEERRILDERRADDFEPEQEAPEPGQTAVAPVVDVISFNGKVERSGGGGSTIWVNGRPVYTGNRTVEGIRIESGRGTNAETRFVLPPSDVGETEFSLKPGQKIAVQSGKVLDSYEARAAEGSESVFATKPGSGESAAPAGEPVPAQKEGGSAPAKP